MADSGITIFNGVGSRLVMLEEGLMGRARASFERSADDILAYAQANAPWSDRTGTARDGLETEVSEENGELWLELAHTVDYGQWLETIQSGRFAIIMPTLEMFADRVFSDAGGAAIDDGVMGSDSGSGDSEGGDE